MKLRGKNGIVARVEDNDDTEPFFRDMIWREVRIEILTRYFQPSVHTEGRALSCTALGIRLEKYS